MLVNSLDILIDVIYLLILCNELYKTKIYRQRSIFAYFVYDFIIVNINAFFFSDYIILLNNYV